jgi:hypothetical protein
MKDSAKDNFESDDALVDEARRAGKSYIDSFHGDWDALIADLNQRSERAGRKIVSFSSGHSDATDPKLTRRPKKAG